MSAAEMAKAHHSSNPPPRKNNRTVQGPRQVMKPWSQHCLCYSQGDSWNVREGFAMVTGDSDPQENSPLRPNSSELGPRRRRENVAISIKPQNHNKKPLSAAAVLRVNSGIKEELLIKSTRK
ncbi:hypothetical protein MHYP_G00252880 [Metynnis hypsauchen]